MNRLPDNKRPMWKKTMLQRLSLNDIQEDLEEISEAGDYCGYEGESLGEYYDEYRPLFDELAMGAYDLLESISRIVSRMGITWKRSARNSVCMSRFMRRSRFSS